METTVSLFLARRKGFLEQTRVACPVDEYCACEGADLLFDVEGVLGQRLVDVGEGVKVSEPLEVERHPAAPVSGSLTTLSHRGVLAIYSPARGSLWFVDLGTGRRVMRRVRGTTLVGFYDDMALALTWDMPLRDSTVEDVFRTGAASLRGIGGTSGVKPGADVSLLNERRVLYYCTRGSRLFAFNVDTRVNAEVDIGRRVSRMLSLTGIDCGVRAVFFDSDDDRSYSLYENNSVTIVEERLGPRLKGVFPSASSPKRFRDAVFTDGSSLLRRRKEMKGGNLVRLDWGSITRVYRDVFLAYNGASGAWYLIRVVVP